MKRIATFAWSATVPVPAGFDDENPTHIQEALDAAWLQVQKEDGELTDLQDDGVDTPPPEETEQTAS